MRWVTEGLSEMTEIFSEPSWLDGDVLSCEERTVSFTSDFFDLENGDRIMKVL